MFAKIEVCGCNRVACWLNILFKEIAPDFYFHKRSGNMVIRKTEHTAIHAACSALIFSPIGRTVV